ncbi:hypothetical protein P7K49_031839 [Saguinus oedipus]|uniref:Uncharacterized protein n=1 Tax=Saguinus oedipus TaxID=9490 RepID=A0ABQ9U0L5_SAGOE|nr:hypothetical protein P7K49_031839 [Saguinus oedipus]
MDSENYWLKVAEVTEDTWLELCMDSENHWLKVAEVTEDTRLELCMGSENHQLRKVLEKVAEGLVDTGVEELSEVPEHLKLMGMVELPGDTQMEEMASNPSVVLKGQP